MTATATDPADVVRRAGAGAGVSVATTGGRAAAAATVGVPGLRACGRAVWSGICSSGRDAADGVGAGAGAVATGARDMSAIVEGGVEGGSDHNPGHATTAVAIKPAAAISGRLKDRATG